MMGLVFYLAVFGLLTGSDATFQTFTSFGVVNISSCPITYYGQVYEKVFVSLNAKKFAFCFNGTYSAGTPNDCILMSGGTADRGELETYTRDIPVGSGVHQLLPDLKFKGRCVNVIPLRDSLEAAVQQVELGNFGTQAILGIRTFSGYTNTDIEADSQVNGQTVSKKTFQTSDTSNGVITDMSGCRMSGVVYKTNTTTNDPQTCSEILCDPSGVAKVVSKCGPMERCHDGSCVPNKMCILAGSAIIDFAGKVHTVPDRCGYTLLSPKSIPGFEAYGVFRERRRKDINFLSHVILKLKDAGVVIVLKQGRVELNGKVLELNVTAQVFHGVKLSKDQRGVTAKISKTTHMVSVFFDGDKALIQIAGPKAAVQGLCGDDSKGFNQEKVSEYSSSGCEVQHEDTTDPDIDCEAATKWCTLLKQAPFTACNKHIDPESFITACKNTLCKYPAEDGFKCKALEIYAMLCSKNNNNMEVEDWRKKTGCSPRPSCLNTYCSDHEFCGHRYDGGQPRCLCRALFTSKHKSENTYGEPTVCEHKSASVQLANCLLAEHGIDYSILHLNDMSCKGEKDDNTHMVTFRFNGSKTCGTVVKANDSKIIYKNTIMTQNISAMGAIYRHDQMHFDFSCYYDQPDIKSFAVRLKHSSVDQHITSGAWSYNLTMKGYTDAELTQSVESSTEIQLNERIWVELKTEGLDEKLVHVVVHSCWATNQPSPSGNLKYDLVINGCPNPADNTVRTKNNGMGTNTVVSFDTFQFTGQNTDVFLHCRVQLCVAEGNSCVPKCSKHGRWRRSVLSSYMDENPAIITMAWTS